MSLFIEIQNDILAEKPISTILRKAKVLAYNLKNQEFKDWIEFELNGYRDEKSKPLPDYRIFKSQSFGHFRNMAWDYSNVSIPISVLPEEIYKWVSSVEMFEGVKELESMADRSIGDNEKTSYKYLWPPEFLPYLHNTVYENMGCLSAWRLISINQIAQILDTIRNRLLSFILELSDRYPDEIKSDSVSTTTIPDDQIRQVFNVFIMGNNPSLFSKNSLLAGGDLTVFDQRNQKVEKQYNAARDINLEAVTNRKELIEALEILKDELAKNGKSKVIENDAVVKVEKKLAETIKLSQKPKPNKKTMIENIEKAVAVLKGITAATGFVTALIKVTELISKLY